MVFHVSGNKGAEGLPSAPSLTLRDQPWLRLAALR